MANTHRAVIEFAVPPRMRIIASGPEQWVRDRLTEYLEKYPRAIRPYDDNDDWSGGEAIVMALLPS